MSPNKSYKEKHSNIAREVKHLVTSGSLERIVIEIISYIFSFQKKRNESNPLCNFENEAIILTEVVKRLNSLPNREREDSLIKLTTLLGLRKKLE